MIKAFLRAAVLLMGTTPVIADELQPPSDQAHDINCYALTDLKAFLDRAGGKFAELTPEQFQFVRGVYVATPPVSIALPPGDRAGLAVVDSHNELFFIDGDLACDAGALLPPLRQILLDVRDGRIIHVGDGT